MVTITGTLTNAASKAITDCTIILKAKKTTSNVLVKTEAHEVSETGAYNMNVQPGLYDVILLENGFPPKQLGTIEVKSNSKTGTLNDFLILPVTGEIVSSELLDQLIEERTLAQQAAASAKSDATKANTAVTGYVKKTGDTMSGSLTIFRKDPYIILKDSTSGNLSEIDTNASLFYIKTSEPDFLSTKTRIKYTVDTKTLNFENCNSVTIDDKKIIKTGDFGIGDGGVLLSSDEKVISNKASSFIAITSSAESNPVNYNIRGIQSGTSYAMQLLAPDNPVYGFRLFGRSVSSTEVGKTVEFISTINSTVDSNGFYKKASPIVRLINLDSDYGENMEGYTQIGAGYANSEALDVEVKYIDVGHYEIHGSLGFAKSGWYITLPEDGNGNKKIFAEYSQDENGVITVKCFTRKFDMEACAVVADKPTHMPEGRWIDVRLEMPFVESLEDEVIEDDSDIDDEFTQENNDDLSSEQQAE